MILVSGFYDCMHCTSVHVVSLVRMCPASSEAEVMVAHRGRSGRGLIRFAASYGELGMGGFEHGQRFSQLLRAPISAPYSEFRAWISSRRRYLRGGRREEKESNSDQWIGSSGKVVGGYCQFDDMEVLE